VAIFLRLRGELDILMKSVQVIKEFRQLAGSMRPDDESVIHFTSSPDIPLSLFYFNHLPTAIGRFPAYRLSPRLATPALDTYINLDPFVLGLLIPDDGGSMHL
jgi:hypothetical protein